MSGEIFYPARNFGALPPEWSDYETARVVILPVPYDATVSARGGTREGPQGIIDGSQEMELYDFELGREIAEVGIHTLPDVEPVLSGPEAMLARIRLAAAPIVAAGKLLVTLGGDHSISLAPVQVYRERHPSLTVLQLDAHTDLRDEYLSTPFGHATVGRRLSELGPLVQVGIRAVSAGEANFIKATGAAPFTAAAIHRTPDWIEQVLARLGPEVYVTLDLDVLDPGIMPAVGTPEPGGLSWYQVTDLLRAVASERNVVGFDVVELAPREGPFAASALAASLVYKLIGYVTQPATDGGRTPADGRSA
ncbi:MAG: agmatinase [Chloroflexi bacterium]|nr:agmatinase [Chloroflexota bacterium]